MASVVEEREPAYVSTGDLPARDTLALVCETIGPGDARTTRGANATRLPFNFFAAIEQGGRRHGISGAGAGYAGNVAAAIAAGVGVNRGRMS